MNVGRGFVARDMDEGLAKIRASILGTRLKRVPWDHCSDYIFYMITERGEIFGCRKHSDFYLITPLRIVDRYKAGCTVRISLGNQRQLEIYIQNVIFGTFCSGEVSKDMKIGFKDGNRLNYQLSNLYELPDSKTPCLTSLVTRYGEIYQLKYNHILSMVRAYINVSDEISKDCVSNVFLELCSNPRNVDMTDDIFVGQWVNQSRLRAFDYLKRYEYHATICYEDGEEKFGSYAPDYDFSNPLQFLKGKQQKQFLTEWCEGYTPTQIAERHNSTISNVGSVITHAIQKIRTFYNKDIRYNDQL